MAKADAARNRRLLDTASASGSSAASLGAALRSAQASLEAETAARQVRHAQPSKSTKQCRFSSLLACAPIVPCHSFSTHTSKQCTYASQDRLLASELPHATSLLYRQALV